MPNETNPFNEGTINYTDYEVMKDLQWHCTGCELRAAQAKNFQIWRDEYGLQFARTGRNYSESRFCSNCERKTTHRRLLTLDIDESVISRRSSISDVLARRAKVLYRNRDAYSNKEERADALEIDHRCPQVRWVEDESENTSSMPDEEILDKFMLLTRSNNLLKSRSCERCVETGERSTGYGGIEFWYEGTRTYEENLGCVGCIWYDPDAWRAAVQEKLDGGTSTY